MLNNEKQNYLYPSTKEKGFILNKESISIIKEEQKKKILIDIPAEMLLLVHHTRKQQSDDRFEMISGTNGLLGAADGAFLLHKDKRTSSVAVLQISGRDQQDQTLYLNRNQETLVRNLDKAEMVTDVYSEIVDEDRRLNAQKMEEDFYKDSTEEIVDNSTEMLLNALKKLSADDRAKLLKELG